MDLFFPKLYKINSQELNKTSESDARFGNGTCSLDFNFFDYSDPIIKRVETDLTKIMMEAVKTPIFIYDSFFNILGAGGGTIPHRHVSSLDLDPMLNLYQQKFSLVYYLSVGDQNCDDPGILKFHDPDANILPYDGMVAIFPANRKHSAIYGGEKDRVMIGINFYSILS